RWASAMDARDGWLAVDLGAEKLVGRVWMAEIEWQETREFVIEVKQGDTWREVARGTTIGPDKTVEFTPVRAREIRLRVLTAVRPININEFQVYER
ncbi:MAG: discoidin domain-containing protein, partial [Armatimonadetes bacterium]|nr:discoidin domain-containing protein [Armatimonadota bacterium]